MSKRLVKLIISIFYLFYLKIKSKDSYSKSKIFTIIYYHSVGKEQVSNFIRQLDFLCNKVTFISLLDKENAKCNTHKIHVSITFDDALLSVLENAQPELIKRSIPFTIFVPTGFIGKYPSWDIDSEEKIIYEPVMTIEQLKMLDKNLCTIGSHTVNHKNLTLLSLGEAKIEMQSSKEMLEKLLNTKIELFSFPYGAYNSKLVELAKEIGYKGIYTVDYSFASPNKDDYKFGRIAVCPSDWVIELYLKIRGGYNWISILQRRRYFKNRINL
ncbi:MAG: hypothetical protein KatS3mg002_1558 [Candidatus Woesearchaeota archaeon]|nr:MAG: hypothetical protein KatS3mg002_1558 [Candidatus Woesearchaeota archaeon]